MPICGILGCFTRHGVRKDLRFFFFKTSKIIKDQEEENIKTIRRKDIKTEEKWERTIVCSQHFVGGVKAYLHDRTSSAWLPSLHLGKPETSSPVTNVHLANDRFIRSSQRKHKRALTNTAVSLRSLKKRHIDYSKSVTEEQSASHDISAQCDAGSSESVLQLPTEDESHSKGIQTDLTIKEIQQLMDDNKSRLIEASENEKFNIKGLYSFYTGMPELELLKLVFNFIEGHMNSKIKSLSRENEFLLCMLKRRMNYLFKGMAHQLDISVATVQRSFHSTLDLRSGENIPTISKIVKVACCLTNLCPSVVPFD
ncbi:hypothetical protein ACJMK2_043214 [Sinanodonta woodiana]|uniref:THAP-type domain-containing protein n=1 Tax=Sinanodonta woodiana TaxID=1069815 RepID=A0ABD3VW90_SINWO